MAEKMLAARIMSSDKSVDCKVMKNLEESRQTKKSMKIYSEKKIIICIWTLKIGQWFTDDLNENERNFAWKMSKQNTI